ncbi:Histidine kinase [Priestia megaterium]|uniref:CHASE3 domain-containing protein n=1 Tax=Priestia megaterium TaxID=1404 RepID=UPI0011B67289|nr:CHASE3 domain-containing protein [Priestia megaterium]QDZ84272.1 response regulator [Priestia megaterium]
MEKKMRFGIKSKIIIGYLIVIVCLFIAFIVLNSQISSLQKERNFIIDHDIEVHDLTNRIEKHLLDMETGQRGYIITGEASYLEPYNSAASSWEKDYNALYQLLNNNPNQQEKLEKIKGSIQDWIEAAGEPTIALKKENNTKELQQFFEKDPGRQYMDDIRSQFTSFRNVEKKSTETRATELDEKNQKIKIGLYGLLLFVTLISLAIAIVLSNSIVNTIKEVTQTIKRITASKGELKGRIKVRSNDEIKDLGIATNALLENIEERNWLQTNIAHAVTMYQGIASVDKLAEKFLFTVSEMTGASFGAFYVREENDKGDLFVKQAAFADRKGDAGRESFLIGEGLIGQAALEKRTLVINDVPDTYQLIASGLGDVKPKSIFIVPVLFEDEVIAVIELASLHELTVLEQELISQVIETFGLTINGVIRRMEIARLLKESQAMTEELQAQSEELQTQSEELQMQSEELRMINEQLEERTKDAEEKSFELEAAKEDLEEKAHQLELNSQYKSEFLANMSHELRTPLNSILILSEMLEENTAKTLSEDEEEYARIIHSSGKDLLALINDILDLSKVESGKLDVLLAEMNMSELPDQIERNFSHVAEQKKVQLKINKAQDVPNIIHTDEKRFQQIVKNLLSNAFKFTESGSVTVSIQRVADHRLTTAMRTVDTDCWLEIAVADTGIGIPKEKHQLIFEAFQQADGATVRKYGGTGLGLSICSEFAKLLGGWISLSSEVGKGSTFTLYLPSLSNGLVDYEKVNFAYEEVAVSIEEAEPEAEITEIDHPVQPVEPSLPDDENVFQDKRVLIVDDDQRNIFALKTALAKQGMTIMTAHNGIECLEMMKNSEPFDLILMDIMMPQMDGYEAMQKIRGELKLVDLPIIALTAKAMKNDREKCLEAGASDYISKPLDLNQLFSVMRVWLVN